MWSAVSRNSNWYRLDCSIHAVFVRNLGFWKLAPRNLMNSNVFWSHIIIYRSFRRFDKIPFERFSEAYPVEEFRPAVKHFLPLAGACTVSWRFKFPSVALGEAQNENVCISADNVSADLAWEQRFFWICLELCNNRTFLWKFLFDGLELTCHDTHYHLNLQ